MGPQKIRKSNKLLSTLKQEHTLSGCCKVETQKQQVQKDAIYRKRRLGCLKCEYANSNLEGPDDSHVESYYS